MASFYGLDHPLGALIDAGAPVHREICEERVYCNFRWQDMKGIN